MIHLNIVHALKLRSWLNCTEGTGLRCSLNLKGWNVNQLVGDQYSILFQRLVVYGITYKQKKTKFAVNKYSSPKYKYEYKYLGFKYEYNYKYKDLVLKYNSRTSTSTKYCRSTYYAHAVQRRWYLCTDTCRRCLLLGEGLSEEQKIQLALFLVRRVRWCSFAPIFWSLDSGLTFLQSCDNFTSFTV